MAPEVKNESVWRRLAPLALATLAACGREPEMPTPAPEGGGVHETFSPEPHTERNEYIESLRDSLARPAFNAEAITENCRGVSAYNAEWCLKRLGFAVGSPDGSFDKQDMAALSSYQSAVIAKFTPEWPGENFVEWRDKFTSEAKNGVAGEATLSLLQNDANQLRASGVKIAGELLAALGEKLRFDTPDAMIMKRGGGELSKDESQKIQELLNLTGLCSERINCDGNPGKGTMKAFCEFKDFLIAQAAAAKGGDPCGIRRTHKDSAFEQISTRDILALCEFVQLSPDQYALLRRPFLARGDKGSEVMLFQGSVNWLAIDTGSGRSLDSPISRDGIFGGGTADIVKRAQIHFGIPATGLAGWRTQDAAEHLAGNSLANLFEAHASALASMGVSGLRDRFGALQGNQSAIYKSACGGSHLMDPFLPDRGMAELMRQTGDPTWIEYTLEFSGSNLKVANRKSEPHSRSRVAGDGNVTARELYCQLLQDTCGRMGLSRSDAAFAIGCFLVEGNNPEAACGTSSALGGVQFIDETKENRLHKLGIRTAADSSFSPVMASRLSAIWCDILCAADFAGEVCGSAPNRDALGKYAVHHAGLNVASDNLGPHIEAGKSVGIVRQYQEAVRALR